MDIKLIDEFRKQHHNNPYLSSNIAAHQAHHLVVKSDNRLSDASALHCVIEHVDPVIRDYVPKTSKVYRILEGVDDQMIRKSVFKSYQLSKSTGNLIYWYDDSLGFSRRARVRILTNLVFMKKEELNNE